MNLSMPQKCCSTFGQLSGSITPRTYARTSYIVGTHSCAPLQMVLQSSTCVSPNSLIRVTIEEQLRYEPEAETRNRKPLKRPSQIGATWELRFGINNQFRVFYRTDASTRGVYILVIGVKIGNKLLINNEESEL